MAFGHHRGFGVRYIILGLLKKKPMTAIEIIDQIENFTLGYWKPSPGVIYWNLNVLLEEGLIKKQDSKYIITENGLKEINNIWIPGMALFSTDDQISSVINILEDSVETIISKKDELDEGQKQRIKQITEKLKEI